MTVPPTDPRRLASSSSQDARPPQPPPPPPLPPPAHPPARAGADGRGRSSADRLAPLRGAPADPRESGRARPDPRESSRHYDPPARQDARESSRHHDPPARQDARESSRHHDPGGVRLRDPTQQRDPTQSGAARVRRLGPYRLLSLIAQGGMGAVWEAIDDGLGRVVALKTMLPAAAQNPEDVQRFTREAQAASRLSHRNLVPIYHVGEVEGIRYLAMELVRGQTLHERIREKGKLEEGQALAVMIGVTEGLEHAHASGVLHRDLKPANVILQADGTPRLTDFGVAKAAGASRLTASGTALGTPNYMSPEQAMGLNQELDARTDVWGVGAILYECVTGQPPFNESSHMETMQAVVNKALVPPRAVSIDVSRDVEAIVLKCLAKDREERYATTTELLVDLRACLAGRTIRARVPGVLLRAARRVHRNAVIAALALLALGLTLTLAIVSLSEKPPEPPIAAGGAGEGAEAWLAARTEALRKAAQDRERLVAVLADLEPAGLARLMPAERLALEAPPLRAALLALRAEAAVRAAEAAEGGLASAPVPTLAAAALADPRGAWGRRARLALVARLDGRKDAPARDLAAAELRSLATASDELSTQVATRLTRRLAEQARWDEALAAAPADHPLRPLLLGLTPARPLPAADLARLGGGDTVLLARGREVVSWSARSGEERPLGRLLEPPRDLGVAGSGPWAISLAGSGIMLQRLGPGAEREARALQHPGEAPFLVEGGDFDGDGEPDAVGLLWDSAPESVVIPGSEGGDPWSVFPDPREASPWLVGSVLAADLDGDRKDELVLGSSELAAAPRRGVMVRRLDPARGFVARAMLPLQAHVTGLSTFPLAEGKTGLLAVVDWQHGRDAHLLSRRPARDRPWEGRDGVYLLELGAKELTVRARWSYGSDEPATRASAAAVDGIQAWVMRAAGETWVARVGRLADGPRLELLPLRRLLEGDLGEPLALDLTELPPAAPEVRDLDGDGDDELLWGGMLLGLGPVSPTAGPTDPGRPADAARLARLVHLARAGEPLPELARLFEAERPEVASLARLAAVEVPLEQAEAMRAQATLFLQRGLLEPGQRASGEAERLLEQAAVAAQDLAARQDEQVLPDERAAAALLAADAWGRLGQGRRALAALERVPLHELSATRRARVEGVRAAREARERLEPLRFDLTGPGELPLAPFDPLSCRTGRSGLQVELRGRRPGGALITVDLPPASPIVLAAGFRSLGPAWRARFRLGLFRESEGDAGFTGVEVTPWSAFADRTRLELVVDGVPAEAGLFLPEHRTRVAVRLELEPGPEGLLARLTVREGDGGALLLLAERRLLARPCGGRVQLGLLSVPDPADGEEHQQGSVGVVLLESLGLESAPAPRPTPHTAIAAARVALCRGDPAGALTLLDRALAEARSPEVAGQALRYRAIAAGRLGKADAHEDLLEAAEVDPPGTLAALDDQAETLLFGPPEDRVTVARALEAFAAAEDGLLKLFAAALQGQRVEASGEGRPDPSSPRGRALAHALRLASGVERSGPPLAFAAEPLGEAERDALQAGPLPDPRQRERQMVRLVADRPDDPQGWLVFGQMALSTNRLRRAERCFQRGAELGGPLRGECLLGAAMAQLRRFLVQDAIESVVEAAEQGVPRNALEAWLRTAEAIPATSSALQDPRVAELRRRGQ